MNPLVDEWVVKAEGDFVTARRERFARRSPNYDAACFHAQQMAEKYLKAFLQSNQIHPPRTHDLVDLLFLYQNIDQTFALIESDIKGLSGYAVGVRYPGTTVGKDDAVQAVSQALIVRIFLRDKLGLP